MRFLPILAFAITMAVSGASRAETALDAVGPYDKIRLKVLEWLPVKGEYREWGAVGGEYTVGADGTIAVPFVGRIGAAELSLGMLSENIADALQRGLSLPTRPEVSVDVSSRVPVYVIGGVEAPGKVEFTPGLTAIQAVALAGGFYRGGGGGMRLERDTINAEGDLDEARDAVARLTARIARLEAESADAEQFSPKSDDAKQSPFLEEEARLFDVRRQARLSQLESVANRRQLAVDQLNAVDEKSANLDRQIVLTRKQLDAIQKLVDKGLTVATRAFDLERTLTDLEGRRLDLQIGRLSTNLEINEAERDRLDLQTEFRTTVANDLQAAKTLLTQKTLAIRRATDLFNEAAVIAPEKLIERNGSVNVAVRIFLTRAVGENTGTVEIAKDDTLRAGDTIQVQMNVDAARDSDVTNATR